MTFLAYRAARALTQPSARALGPVVKRGPEILEGPYPKQFTDFVGQQQAVLQILAAITSAALRQEPMDHMLLASGMPGIGKTTLGRLAAATRNVGFVELGGTVTDKDVAKALRVMKHGDVLFLDEIHRLVSRGKSKAEWLLTLLQDGELHMPTGVVASPGITVIAATTDAEKLPETILDRFPVRPVLHSYGDDEAVKIARTHALRMGFGEALLPMPTEEAWLTDVARACDNNPRRMGMLLTAVRDIALSTKNGNLSDRGFDITMAREWNGLTEDGLTSTQQQYLVALVAYGGTAGVATLKALLGEGQISLTEKGLIQRGYVTVNPRGRELTDIGTERAQALLQTITTTEGVSA